MTPANEKAAPIPAEGQAEFDVLWPALRGLMDRWEIVALARKLAADRASQEERIREDEREALARHMAAEFAQHEEGYDWELTDRIWQEGWRKAADRALAAIDQVRLRGSS